MISMLDACRSLGRDADDERDDGARRSRVVHRRVMLLEVGEERVLLGVLLADGSAAGRRTPRG
jgi:hypothetical protein